MTIVDCCIDAIIGSCRHSDRCFPAAARCRWHPSAASWKSCSGIATSAMPRSIWQPNPSRRRASQRTKDRNHRRTARWSYRRLADRSCEAVRHCGAIHQRAPDSSRHDRPPATSALRRRSRSASSRSVEGMRSRMRGMIEAKALHDTGPETFDQHVRSLGCKRQQRLACRPALFRSSRHNRLACVQCAAWNNGVPAAPRGPSWHHAVALRRFDLQHLRAEISQQQAGKWSRQVGRYVDQPQAVQEAVQPRHCDYQAGFRRTRPDVTGMSTARVRPGAEHQSPPPFEGLGREADQGSGEGWGAHEVSIRPWHEPLPQPWSASRPKPSRGGGDSFHLSGPYGRRAALLDDCDWGQRTAGAADHRQRACNEQEFAAARAARSCSSRPSSSGMPKSRISR